MLAKPYDIGLEQFQSQAPRQASVMNFKSNLNAQLHTFLILVLSQGEWSASCPNHFITKERVLTTLLTEDWVGPRTSLGIVATYNLFNGHKNKKKIQ